MMPTCSANSWPKHAGFQESTIELIVYTIIAWNNPEQCLIVDTSHIHSLKGRMMINIKRQN